MDSVRLNNPLAMRQYISSCTIYNVFLRLFIFSACFEGVNEQRLSKEIVNVLVSTNMLLEMGKGS
jgi:hypothetical protein